MHVILRRAAVALFLVLCAADVARGANPDPALYAKMEFRNIGPALSGGRASAAAGTDADPFLYYMGTAGGGVWKTANGGTSFSPVFERQGVGSIGFIQISPRDKNVVWVGTGEANPRNTVSYGDGVYVTRDGAKHWKHVGLSGTSQIAALSIDPRNDDTVVVGALGDPFKDSEDRGVFLTTDGGKTWSKTLYVGPSSGVSDLVRDPVDPNVLYAGIWQYQREPWKLTSGGPDGGIYRSTDGGRTWSKLAGHGLPSGPTGRIGLAVARGNHKRVYALVQSRAGVLWRSDNGGDDWRLVSTNTIMTVRPFYFSHVYVDPTNADHLWFEAFGMIESKDGGRTFKRVQKSVHVDHHGLWLSRDGQRMFDVNDGGGALSVDGGKTWRSLLVADIGQFYHVAYDDRIPYDVCGGLQDNAAYCGPSDSRDPSGILQRYWTVVNGGDGMWTVPDPLDPDLIWNDIQDGVIGIFDLRSHELVDVSPYPADANLHGIAALRYRWNWDAPIAFSPQDGHVAYAGANVVFKSTDRGRHWVPISPDLTRDEKAHQGFSGGSITMDNSGAENYDTILALAPSAREPGLIWVGTDDGLVQITRDGGGHWTNVTPKDVEPYGRIEYVEPSHRSPGTAYLNVDRHYSGDRAPYVFKTTDYGATWTKLVAGLPADQFVRVVREDPREPRLLYAGLENSLWCSYDSGAHWQQLQLNLPATSVRDIQIQPRDNDMILATHGRSLWILDDITWLQQLPAAVSAGKYFFQPRDAYRAWEWSLEGSGDPSNPAQDIFAGKNPDGGVLATYFQAKPSARPPSAEIVDAGGRVVRHYAGTHDVEGVKKPYVPNEPGVNRFSWGVTDDPPVKWHGAEKWNQGPGDGPESLPGTYAVRLHLDGATLTRKVRVLPDPRLHWTAAQYVERHAFLARLNDSLSALDRALNQLDDLENQLGRIEKSAPSGAAYLAAIGKTRERIHAVRDALTSNPRNEEDSIGILDKARERVQGALGLIGGSQQPPWPPHRAEADAAVQMADAALAQFTAFVAHDVTALNDALRAAGHKPVVLSKGD